MTQNPFGPGGPQFTPPPTPHGPYAPGFQWTFPTMQEDERARDTMKDGHVVLTAYSMQEVQADGTQKEVWYVP